MTILTGGGSFAQTYTQLFDGKVASIRELGEPAFLEEVRKATCIIHNAATVESNDLELSLTRNFDFTRYLVRKVQALNPDVHFILLSSMSILDQTGDGAYGDVLHMTPYAYSKYLAETYCLKSGLYRFSGVRFSTLFYRDPHKDGLSKLIYEAVTTQKITIYNKGKAARNFLPLPTAAAYVHKLSRETGSQKSGRTYTFAGPQPTSFAEVAEILRRHLPELQVEDKPLAANQAVMADFSWANEAGVKRIGFSLEDEIGRYMDALQS